MAHVKLLTEKVIVLYQTLPARLEFMPFPGDEPRSVAQSNDCSHVYSPFQGNILETKVMEGYKVTSPAILLSLRFVQGIQ